MRMFSALTLAVALLALPALADTGTAVKAVFDPIMAAAAGAPPGSIVYEQQNGPVKAISVQYRVDGGRITPALSTALQERMKAAGASLAKGHVGAGGTHFEVRAEGMTFNNKPAVNTQIVASKDSGTIAVTVGFLAMNIPGR